MIGQAALLALLATIRRKPAEPEPRAVESEWHEPGEAGCRDWYVQKGARVLGPYSATKVRRFMRLGRCKESDRVSRDGEIWEPIHVVPELVPVEILPEFSDIWETPHV